MHQCRVQPLLISLNTHRVCKPQKISTEMLSVLSQSCSTGLCDRKSPLTSSSIHLKDQKNSGRCSTWFFVLFFPLQIFN